MILFNAVLERGFISFSGLISSKENIRRDESSNPHSMISQFSALTITSPPPLSLSRRNQLSSCEGHNIIINAYLLYLKSHHSLSVCPISKAWPKRLKRYVIHIISGQYSGVA